MKAKTIVPRELANRDVDEAIEHYLSEGAEQYFHEFWALKDVSLVLLDGLMFTQMTRII